ncbi:serine protease inhibitor Kazal-type 7-like [Gracilinanus agilis]|uniref:serine protease inhibitor Kazal-type 7-like n=1 Tax=Gracilinanus agilis TaxID=191870 RepID=UPI001CFF15F2|nr:serine protease inhibitor Kazal-type 7-like [Gracilinanus agilis]
MKIAGFLLLFALAHLCLTSDVEDENLGEEDCDYYKKFPLETISCPVEYFPVCGSDFITYGNGCHLCVANLKTNGKVNYVHDGPCCRVL